MNNETSLAIHFKGLDAKECALFDRIISFSAKHGLVADNVDDVAKADLIIVNLESFPSIEQYTKDKTSIVVANDETIKQGDFQITRPLMITKVMSSLSAAIEMAKTNKANGTTKSSTDNSDGLVEINIEDATTQEDEAASQGVDTIDEQVTEKAPAAHHALVIDDSAAIRKQLELELRDAGITSEFAESGEQALEIIKDKHFDLVFLDIIMPGLDGYETCKAMRSVAAYKKTPIVMLSGKTSPLDEVQGVIAGATTYLTKPVKSHKLQEILNRLTKWIENYAPPKKSENV